MGCNCVRAVDKHEEHPHDYDHSHDGFTYLKGGADWDVSIGKRQSPIDVPTANVIYNSEEIPIIFKLSFSKKPVSLSLEYTPNGFTVKNSTGFFGEIHLDIPKEKKFQVYESKNLHFHAKSEHRFDGVQYDAELHIVFIREKLPIEKTLDSATDETTTPVRPEGTTKTEDNFCIIGILFKIDDDNALLENDKIIEDFSPSSSELVTIPFIVLYDLLKPIVERNPEFFYYKGSLTTPPCSETVSWFVYNKVLSVKKDTLAPFHTRWVENKEFNPTGAGNARPVNPLHERPIFQVRPVLE